MRINIKKILFFAWIFCLVAITLLFVQLEPANAKKHRRHLRHPAPYSYNASEVLGQLDDNGDPDFLTNDANCDSDVDATTLCYPDGDAVIDTNYHRLFVSDSSSNRVLIFNLDNNNRLLDYIADNVLGQPDLTSFSSGLSRNKMSYPTGLAWDSSRNYLFVIDAENNRVLVYNVSTIVNGQNAINVLGQSNFTSGDANLTQNGMGFAYGIMYDSVRKYLFVADSENNRVLVYNVSTIVNGQNAINVLGQLNFTSNSSGTSQNTMSYPDGLGYDKIHKRLFIADADNYRVLVYNVSTIVNGQNAINVLGQLNFTSRITTVSRDRLGGYLYGEIGYDETYQRLFVTVYGASRILVFDVSTINNGQAAIAILGQGLWTTRNVGPDQDRLTGPESASYYSSPDHTLLISDYDDNRITIFKFITLTSPSSLANAVLGSSYNTTIAASYYQGIYTIALTAGSLPPGLSMNANGVISGVPTTPGTYTFHVQVSDDNNINGIYYDDKDFTIVVSAPSVVENTKPSPQPVSEVIQPSIPPPSILPPTINQLEELSDSSPSAGSTLSGQSWFQVILSPFKKAISWAIKFLEQGIIAGWNTLKKIIIKTPPPVANSFPYFIFAPLGIMIFLLLRQAIRETAHIKYLKTILKRELLVAEEKDNFLALSSHYLRTPLTLINVGVAMLAGNVRYLKDIPTAITLVVKHMLTKVDKLTKDITDNTYLKQISAPRFKEEEFKVTKSPYLLIPLISIGAIAILADYLFINVAKINIPTYNLFAEALTFIVLAQLFYTQIRQKHIIQHNRQRLIALLNHQYIVDTARNNFIEESQLALEGDVIELKQLLKQVPSRKNKDAVEEGVHCLEDIIEKFHLLISVRSGRTRLNKHKFNFKDQIVSIISTAQKDLKAKHLKLVTNIKVGRITQDANKLKLIISNLLQNAIKFSHDGGEIKLTAVEEDGNIQVIISDNGIGISEEAQSLLFKPFSRANSALKEFSYEGLGFSLFLDKIMLTHLNGEISIQSAPKAGTTVTIRIPNLNRHKQHAKFNLGLGYLFHPMK